MSRVVMVLLGLLVGAAIGVGATLALSSDDETAPAKQAGLRPVLCETDAARIASAYNEAPDAASVDFFADCQLGLRDHANGDGVLEGASLAPEYRCTFRVQLASSPYGVQCYATDDTKSPPSP